MAAERQQAPGTDMGQPKKEGQKEDIYGTGEYVRWAESGFLKLTGLLRSGSRVLGNRTLGLKALT